MASPSQGDLQMEMLAYFTYFNLLVFQSGIFKK